MKTLSILQPWASLVMLELKRFETRSWPTNYRGPILIHSSARKDKEGRRLWKDVFVPNMPPEPCVASMPIRFDDLPFGHVLCRANLVDVIPTQSVLREITIHEKIFGNWAVGRFAWRLEDVTRIYPHLPAKGSLGFWEFELPRA
jgi:hypothetical protein